MEFVLDDNGVWEYTQINIPKLATLDAQALSQWNKDTIRAKRIILEGVIDHVVSNLKEKETHFSMWKNLIDLFHSNNADRKLALTDKIKSI